MNRYTYQSRRHPHAVRRRLKFAINVIFDGAGLLVLLAASMGAVYWIDELMRAWL